MNCPEHGPMVWRFYPMGWACPPCLARIRIVTTNRTSI
jgi:hypothetical protein